MFNNILIFAMGVGLIAYAFTTPETQLLASFVGGFATVHGFLGMILTFKNGS